MSKKDKPPCHAGKILSSGCETTYLLLKKNNFGFYQWHTLSGKETKVTGNSITEAIEKGRKYWKSKAFRTLHCGFKFTLPERDEHGTNALFKEMATSYLSMNGVYVDPELGCPCIVRYASNEALDLWRRL